MCYEDIYLVSVKGKGNLVVLFGVKIGGDGIGGVFVLVLEMFELIGLSKCLVV